MYTYAEPSGVTTICAGPQNTHQRDLMREAKVDMQGVLEESYGGEPQAKRHRGLQLSSLTIIHTSAADALPEAQGSCASDSAAPAALDASDEWDETWERHLQLLEAFKAVNGHPHAQISDVGVGPWVKEQRQLFKDGKLSPAQEQRLRNIGFVFDRMAAAQMRTALELSGQARAANSTRSAHRMRLGASRLANRSCGKTAARLGQGGQAARGGSLAGGGSSDTESDDATMADARGAGGEASALGQRAMGKDASSQYLCTICNVWFCSAQVLQASIPAPAFCLNSLVVSRAAVYLRACCPAIRQRACLHSLPCWSVRTLTLCSPRAATCVSEQRH